MATKKYGVNELREMFLSFFESKGHLRLQRVIDLRRDRRLEGALERPGLARLAQTLRIAADVRAAAGLLAGGVEDDLALGRLDDAHQLAFIRHCAAADTLPLRDFARFLHG